MSTINNPIVVSKDDAIRLLDTNPKPVIFWDTCSLLDIIRLPIPDRKQSVNKLKNVMAIRQKIESGDIISLASILTVKEFNDHVGHTQAEVKRAAHRITEEYNKYLNFVKTANPAITSQPVDLAAFNLEISLNDIVQDIAVNTRFIDREDLFLRNAEARVTGKIPPAKKKGEFKDCYIWSTCLAVRQLSQRTCNPYGFMSSNVRDYAETGKTQFDVDIAAEATTANINYYAGFDIAFGKLKAEGVL